MMCNISQIILSFFFSYSVVNFTIRIETTGIYRDIVCMHVPLGHTRMSTDGFPRNFTFVDF